MCRESATVGLTKSPTAAQRTAENMADRLAALSDPRARRGRRHSLVSVLLTAACAVLAGARSCLAIGRWARNAPQDTLSRLGVRAVGPLRVRRAPSTGTIRRVLVVVCPGGLADLLGCDPAGAESLAVDGKTARGSRTDTAHAAHLLSALTADGRVASQLRVPDKTTEVTALAPLLAPFDLTGTVVTRDALHTTAAGARFLVEGKHTHCLLAVKANQPLFAALRALPRGRATARFRERGRGHGRDETRSVTAPTVTGLDLGFPHVVQAAKIHRWRRDRKTGRVSRQTVYAVTEMTARQASPQRITQLARSEWGIEALHHVRDTTFAEDASKIRTGHGPENMATLRNLAVHTLRRTGHRSTAAGLREVPYAAFTRPLDLLDLA